MFCGYSIGIMPSIQPWTESMHFENRCSVCVCVFFCVLSPSIHSPYTYWLGVTVLCESDKRYSIQYACIKIFWQPVCKIVTRIKSYGCHWACTRIILFAIHSMLWFSITWMQQMLLPQREVHVGSVTQIYRKSRYAEATRRPVREEE